METELFFLNWWLSVVEGPNEKKSGSGQPDHWPSRGHALIIVFIKYSNKFECTLIKKTATPKE